MSSLLSHQMTIAATHCIDLRELVPWDLFVNMSFEESLKNWQFLMALGFLIDDTTDVCFFC